jgi:hypothetical protein
LPEKAILITSPIAKVMPLYYLNEGFQGAMVFEDNMAALRCSASIGAFAAAVLIPDILATKREESL